jgi:hypothetical protein
MEKGLLFLTLAMLCLWLILDEFFGNSKLSALAQRMTPDVPNIWEAVGVPPLEDVTQADKNRNEAKEKVDKSEINGEAKKQMKKMIDKFYGEMA